MIKFKEFDVGDADYKEQMEQFQTEHQNAEFVQITGGHMSYEKIWFKYEPSDISDTTDKLSVEKLEPIGYYNEAHGFLHDEFDKDCYCQGSCSMEAVYTESQVKKLTDKLSSEKIQEQLNTAKKYIEHVIRTIKHDGHLGTIQTDWILPDLEKALAAIGNEGSGDE